MDRLEYGRAADGRTPYSVSFAVCGGGVVCSGEMGGIAFRTAPLFRITLKRLSDGTKAEYGSDSAWETAELSENGIRLSSPGGIDGITVAVAVTADDSGLSLKTSVTNENAGYSVMRLSYPAPMAAAAKLTLFLPLTCGVVVEDPCGSGYRCSRSYPGADATMQFFAVYGEGKGLYLGVHDGTGAAKLYDAEADDSGIRITPTLVGIGAGLGANSFELPGVMRWQALGGDWYDAAEIYRGFVLAEANWLPERGRPDTDPKFRELPFWIADYVPNSAYQGDNRPKSISAGSDIYEPDYWIDAAIRLKHELGVPVGYHVYNWHEIPFNLEYPHFLPAKKCFLDGMKKLQDEEIYVMPYINAVSWEANDDMEGHAVNYKNTGVHGSVVREDGSPMFQQYPQVKPDGTTARLMQMCPESRVWRGVIGEVARGLEELGVDGVYFDQVAATSPGGCWNPEHRHLPGGGTHWTDGYREMMAEIRAARRRNIFCFTEDNAEQFIGAFDGMLTWVWLHDRDVPAYPAVYAGYGLMIGRSTMGAKKDDRLYFRYMMAKCLLYGQALGWCKADVVYDPDKLVFLKNAVRTRWIRSDYFADGSPLRPPKVSASIPGTLSEPCTHFSTEYIHIDSALAGCWRNADGKRALLIVVNIADQPNEVSLTFPADEYGAVSAALPAGITVTDGVGTLSAALAPFEVRTYELELEGEEKPL